MKTMTTDSPIIFEEREASAEGDIVGKGHGLAVPYGTETDLGGVR